MGWSLPDRVAPFVVINSYDAKPTRSFTLLHEMVHLVLGHSAFASFVGNHAIERLCDRIAGDLLLKERDFHKLEQLQGRSMQSGQLRYLLSPEIGW